MPRPSRPAYTLGTIATRPHPTMTGQVQARGSYRDDNGRRIDVTASGKTEAAARRALQGKANLGRTEHRGGDAVLRHDAKVTRAAAVWLDWKERQEISPATRRDYRGYVKNSINGSDLADLTIVQANDVARIEAWLTKIADERGDMAARQSRKVLSGILGLAERRGAIPASVMHRAVTPKAKSGSVGDRRCANAECDHDCGKRHHDTRRAFTADEAGTIQTIADGANADVGDLAAFLFGTGVRISEALHCTAWADVDLDAGTVRVRGTKTAQADRTLTMSDDLIERLRRRADLHGTAGLVFGVVRYASKAGQPRDRNNVSKGLRKVFATAGVRWAGTHTFRRTVASWMDEAGCPLAEIANQLGHADTNITAQYLGRKTAPTRAASVMVLPKKASKGHLHAV